MCVLFSAFYTVKGSNKSNIKGDQGDQVSQPAHLVVQQEFVFLEDFMTMNGFDIEFILSDPNNN